MNNQEMLSKLSKEVSLMKARAAKKAKALNPVSETHKSSVGQDIKNSYIQNLHMRSSMFYLWIISGILGYAHKIPFIGRIITLLSLWYGRTTIWKILIKVRKVFIAFNAAIGVYMVYKTVGFSTDNLFAGFAGMGTTYLEIFINSTKRLFHWFFELFDHKIVPNVPNTPPTSPPTWWPTQTPKSNQWIDNYLNKPVNTDWFKSPFSININTSIPWYKDISTWMWIGTIAGATVGIVGLSYISYIYLADPIISFFKPGPATNINPPSPEGESIELAPPIPTEGFKSSIVSYIFRPLKRLNPFNWFLASSEAEAQFQRFMGKQNELISQDNRFYPFTQINPHASWFERFRIHYFGETTVERTLRVKLREQAWNELTNLSVKPVGSIPVSPLLSSVGLGIPNLPSGSLDIPAATEWTNSLVKKISSIPSTPGSETPVNSPNLSNPFNETSISEAVSRLSNSPDSITDNISASPPQDLTLVDASLQNRLDSLASPSPVNSPMVSENKFNFLDEINI